MNKWRDQIKNNQNPGLALRWIAALAEMEPTLGIPKVTRQKAEKLWRNTVIKFLKQFDNLDYFDSAEDTASIVSVRIKHSETGNWMVKSELAKVFKAMTLDVGQWFLNIRVMGTVGGYVWDVYKIGF